MVALGMPFRIHACFALAALLVGSRADALRGPRLPKPKRGFQMHTTPYVLPPASDEEWCEYRRLPNRHAMEAQGFELRMPAGAHHFVLWAYNGNVTDDTQFPKGPVESVACTGLGPHDTFIPANLFGMQTPSGRVRFPDGIAVRLKPHQQVWLNPHMKNFSTTDDLRARVVFNITPAKKGTVRHHAETFVVGNIPGIDVPADGTQTLVSEWTSPADLNVIQLSSHQHRLGTYVSASLEQPDGSFVQVFENHDWEHPRELWTHEEAPWKDQDPPIIRLARGQRMRFTCKWQNTDTKRVTFGVETTDEMCFVTGYFYRDDEASPPISGAGCFTVKEGLMCPLARTLSSAE
jgi:copper type II ascorbate-dependent monooxygenase-like protein